MACKFISRENKVWFSRNLDFCVFVKSTNFKICDIIIGITTYWKLLLCCFLLNPKYYQNEIWSTLVCCIKNVSDIFLA